MIWNMTQTKKAYQCRNVKTRTTINWSSCANDGISKDKHFSRLQGHNLLDNNVNLKLKFSCCLGQDLQVHATAPLYMCTAKDQHPTQPQTYPVLFFAQTPVKGRSGFCAPRLPSLPPSDPPHVPLSHNFDCATSNVQSNRTVNRITLGHNVDRATSTVQHQTG